MNLAVDDNALPYEYDSDESIVDTRKPPNHTSLRRGTLPFLTLVEVMAGEAAFSRGGMAVGGFEEGGGFIIKYIFMI